MITLRVEGYCHECPEFSPEKSEKYVVYGAGGFLSSKREYEVVCEHYARCKAIENYLLEQMSEEDKKL